MVKVLIIESMRHAMTVGGSGSMRLKDKHLSLIAGALSYFLPMKSSILLLELFTGRRLMLHLEHLLPE
jgi:hypothetical protein